MHITLGATFSRNLFPEFFFSIMGTFLCFTQWALIRTIISKTVDSDEVKKIEQYCLSTKNTKSAEKQRLLKMYILSFK